MVAKLLLGATHDICTFRLLIDVATAAGVLGDPVAITVSI